MSLSTNVLTQAALAALAVLWIGSIGRRWRRDLHEFRTSQEKEVRIVIAGLWAITAWVTWNLCAFVTALVRRLL